MDREIFKRGEYDIQNEALLTAIVGESGCGKSTISAILTGRNKGYGGSVSVGETELSEIREADLMENITYISHQSYLFKGTVRDNLLMGKPDASDSELWEVLERVNLADFVRNEKGPGHRFVRKSVQSVRRSMSKACACKGSSPR